MAERPWFERAFGAEYLALYAHRSDEQGASQVAALMRSGLLDACSPLLDLGCGAGRHLKAMRAAGLRALGLDLSRVLLAEGRLSGAAVRGDMRWLPFSDNSFASVTSLFTSFGYFESDEENLAVLREVRRVLRPGGALLLDHMNPGPTLSALVRESRESIGGAEVVARRRFDSRRRRVIKEVEYRRGGQCERWHESVRLFEPDELDVLLVLAGLNPERRCADFSGAAFSVAESPRQLVRAVKA